MAKTMLPRMLAKTGDKILAASPCKSYDRNSVSAPHAWRMRETMLFRFCVVADHMLGCGKATVANFIGISADRGRRVLG